MTGEPTVFVVDDDAAVRASLAELLQTAGYTVATYACAEDFLAGIFPEACGCIVLDIRMPGMNGLDLQNELMKRSIDLPVIIVSRRTTNAWEVPRTMKSTVFLESLLFVYARGFTRLTGFLETFVTVSRTSICSPSPNFCFGTLASMRKPPAGAEALAVKSLIDPV